MGEGGVVACGVATVHRLEHVFAATLDGNVDELVNAIIREAIQKCFLIAEDMARIAHAEADAVIAVHVRQDSLREFGEIRTDVEAVAGAVLSGKLDFEATIIDERLDLIYDGLGRKAVETAFDEMRAAEGASVEAAFFDVHDADERGFAKDVARVFIADGSARVYQACGGLRGLSW